MGLNAAMEAAAFQRLDDHEVLELSRQLRECFGASYGIERISIFDSALRHQVLEDEPGTMLRLDLNGDRYYSFGYERGPIIRHLAIAAWLEVVVPGCTVYYGSNMIAPDIFDARARDEVFTHFCHNASRPYRVQLPTEFDCPDCERAIAVNKWGPGPLNRSGSCLVCGKRYSTQDDGATWV